MPFPNGTPDDPTQLTRDTTGVRGGTVVDSATSFNGSAKRIVVLVDATLTALTCTGLTGSSKLLNQVLIAGTQVVATNITAFTLSSGLVIAYAD